MVLYAPAPFRGLEAKSPLFVLSGHSVSLLYFTVPMATTWTLNLAGSGMKSGTLLTGGNWKKSPQQTN
jgi:hypothetical protein